VLGEEIAQGGMGVVYRARDAVFGREVAVKVLWERFGSGSAAARRFADEARITGQLQHPAIPPVHDLGTLSDGRPFMAMKLIKGETLADRLGARSDPGHDRGYFVAVFEQVCQAVAYAHARDVIHRDLKPSNVMVGNFGEVQVMDWGLAKVLIPSAVPGAAPGADSEPTGDTKPGTAIRSMREDEGALTQAGSVLGTPAFMPPEQAIGAVDQIDVRSDVFGLGGILCAVLTGQPPFVAETAESTRQAAAKGKVGDAFARLDGCGAEPALVALCKRCLSPEKEHRPANAREVADTVAELRADADERARRAEVERAAADARAAAEQKRRRTQLLFGSAVVVVLLAGIGGTVWWLLEAKRQEAQVIEEGNKKEIALRERATERDRANTNAARADINAAAANANADRADANADRANATVAEYFTTVSENKLLKSPLPGLQPLRKELLLAALAHYQRFAAEQKDDPRVRVELARAYYRVGRIQADVGTRAEAEAAQRAALAVWEEVLRASPTDTGYRKEAARARVALVGVLAVKPEVAPDWETHFRAAEGTFTELLAANANDTDARQGLASLYSVASAGYDKLGKHDLETDLTRRAYAEWEKVAAADPKYATNFASAAIDLGYCYTREGNAKEALRFHERGRDEFARLVKADPSDTAARLNLARAYTNIGYLHTSVNQNHKLAAEAFEASVREAAPLVRDHPAVVRFRLRYCVGLCTWAKALIDSRQPEKAFAPLREGIASLEETLRIDPNDRTAVMELGLAYGTLARLEVGTGKLNDGLKSIQKACETMDKLVAINPLSTDDRGALARSYRLAGLFHRVAGDLPASRKALERALAVLEEPAPADRPTNVSYRSQIVVAVTELGRTLRKSGDLEAAERALARVDVLWNKEMKRDTSAVQLAQFLSVGFAGYGSVLLARGKPDEAQRAFESAVQLAGKGGGFDGEDLVELACAEAQLSVLPVAGKPVPAADAERHAKAAMRLLQSAATAFPDIALGVIRNNEFAPLRDRDDFKRLVADLEARPRPKK
jgi:serine/threonine protein kinase